VSCATTENGSRTVKGMVMDKDGGVREYIATAAINNVAPLISSVAGPVGPLPISAATATVTANFTDPGSSDTHSCTFAWDDSTPNAEFTASGTGDGSCTSTHTYAAAGVYAVQVTVADDDGGTATTKYEYVVIYDANGGFVTGGGWINSPAGAYIANPSLTGKAHFGFVSKYQKGASKPTGETEFKFQVANFNFHSTSYDWLVVAGSKAQYKGTGSINGTGEYGFLLTATDGNLSGGGGADKFRIKIWDKANGANVYDNVLAASDDIDTANPQVIGGGSIVVHK
jgi:PKD repeat protein